LSAIDDLRSAQQQAFARLDELKPLVAEYEELRHEIERLGLTNASSPKPIAADAEPHASRSMKPARRRASSSKSAATAATSASKPTNATAAKSTSKTRAPGGSRSSSRADDVARLVTQQPAITVAELGRTLGVNATSLYNPVRRLVTDGRLRKDGPALHPAT
jgi:hypothetical protein